MDRKEKLNMAMLFDFYEMTMANGYFRRQMEERITYFDVFFRRVPDGGGFAIAAGLEQLLDYIEDFHFDGEDIDYLRSKHLFEEDFLDYLRTFRFAGDIWAVPEGTPVFPNEPLITVRAPAAWVCADLFLLPASAACTAKLRRLYPNSPEESPAPPPVPLKAGAGR